MDAKKIPAACCPLGKAALLLRFFSLSGCLFYVGAINSGIGSCDDGKGRCSGSAYIFTKGIDGNWRQQAKLTAADGMAWDYFGGFMSLSTDGSTALVGVWSDDFRKGSAYLFVQGTDGNWRQQAKLSAADSAEDDEFNVSIALSGDSNMALIGAFMDDDKRKSCGSTYIFGGAPITVHPLNTAPTYNLLLLYKI